MLDLMAGFVQELRRNDLYKKAGTSETLDWAAALVALDRSELDVETIEETLGILLKNQEDLQAMHRARIEAVLGRALTGS